MELPTRPRTAKPNGRQPHHALTTAFVRNVAQAGRYCDGDGLYLDMQPTGTRSWLQRLVIRGQDRELGLGGFPLKDARAAALANRRLARAGGDPLAEKHRLKSMPTFSVAAEAVLAQMRPGWRNPKHGKDWLSSMARFALPRPSAAAASTPANSRGTAPGSASAGSQPGASIGRSGPSTSGTAGRPRPRSCCGGCCRSTTYLNIRIPRGSRPMTRW